MNERLLNPFQEQTQKKPFSLNRKTAFSIFKLKYY